jgi:hypothetical protein
MRVRVRIDPPANELPPGGAIVRTFIEDTSRVGDAARPIAESTIRVDQMHSASPLEITCREPGADESFTVRVHVDVNGSGQVEVGDLVSTAAHRAIDGDLQIPLRRV